MSCELNDHRPCYSGWCEGPKQDFSKCMEILVTACENEKKQWDDDVLKKAIKAVADMDTGTGIPQSVYIIEECSELIKELTKEIRGKGSEKDIISEACDILVTIFVMFAQRNIPMSLVRDSILYKCNRALDRHHKNGEL